MSVKNPASALLLNMIMKQKRKDELRATQGRWPQQRTQKTMKMFDLEEAARRTHEFSCIRLCDPRTVTSRLLCPYSLGKDIGVGCHALLQGIFQTQGSNLNLLCWQADSLPLCCLEQEKLTRYFQWLSKCSRKFLFSIPSFESQQTWGN